MRHFFKQFFGLSTTKERGGTDHVPSEEALDEPFS